jgi:glycine cleavage system T protein (aminomethyltransferase)
MAPIPVMKKTPLNQLHREADARLVEFAGWEMPVQYAGVIEEHLAVRRQAGLFDVSHMGEIVVRGPRALEAVQHLTSNDASRLADGQAQYSALTTEKGTPVDDILVYRIAADHFFLCVNASNDDKDFAWIRDHMIEGAEARHASDEYAQLALQGPRSEAILSRLTGARLASIPSFSFVQDRVAGRAAMISRTGYTGEDGFEIYCAPADAPDIWTALMEKGKADGLQPVGLGARDTLRLEACLALYGNDIDDTTTLLEAGLGFIVKLEKPEFLGLEALRAQRREGLKRRLVGFEMVERGIARHGYPASLEGSIVGQVTSGSYAPFIRNNIGLVYLPIDRTRPGQEFDVMIRAKAVRARVIPIPFYKRGRPPA